MHNLVDVEKEVSLTSELSGLHGVQKHTSKICRQGTTKPLDRASDKHCINLMISNVCDSKELQ